MIFMKSLDSALSSFNVERQAYHSGSFVGNHINRALKPKNTETLCHSIIETAINNDPTLLSEATQVSEKFEKAFSKFAACHNLYESTMLKDNDVLNLGKYLAFIMQHNVIFWYP